MHKTCTLWKTDRLIVFISWVKSVKKCGNLMKEYSLSILDCCNLLHNRCTIARVNALSAKWIDCRSAHDSTKTLRVQSHKHLGEWVSKMKAWWILFQPDVSFLFTKANRREGANENTWLNSWEREVFLKPLIRPLTATLTRVDHSDPIWSIWVDWDTHKNTSRNFTKQSGIGYLAWPKWMRMPKD